MVKPVTVIGEVVPTAVAPPGEAVTVYDVAGVPESAPDTAKFTVAWASPAIANTPVMLRRCPVGVPNTPVGMRRIGSGTTGTTELDGRDARPSPTALVATTVNVYGVPFDNPDTTQLNGPVVHEHANPPGDDVTVYPVIVEPPSLTGATQLTVT